MRGPAALLALVLPLGAVAAVLWLPAGWSAVPLLALAAVTLAQSRPVRAPAALVAAALAAMALASAVWQSALAAMLYPVAVNAGLLASFLLSLRETPAIERLARLADPSIPASAAPYLRGLTKVWCGFFALNGLVALATALHGDRKVWALYNGVIAYALIGLLILGERWLRPRLAPADA